LPAGVVGNPVEWQLAIASHLNQEAADGRLVFGLGLGDHASGDELIEDLPHRHGLILLDDLVDGVADRLDGGFGAAAGFCGASHINRDGRAAGGQNGVSGHGSESIGKLASVASVASANEYSSGNSSISADEGEESVASASSVVSAVTASNPEDSRVADETDAADEEFPVSSGSRHSTMIRRPFWP
jgi:hypothetical protein